MNAMRRLLLLLGVLGLVSPPAIAVDFYLAPDAPIDLVGVGTSLPWTVTRHVTPFTYTTAIPQPLPLPFNTETDALHLMNSGDWLFSVGAPTTIGATTYQPEDVVRYSTAAVYSTFFCGTLPPLSIPSGSNVDAAFLTNQRDAGNLVLSFAAPTTIGGITYEPADLIEFMKIGPLCQDWAVVGLLFDASAVAFPVAPGVNVTGADEYLVPNLPNPLRRLVLAFNVPTTLAGTTYLPGELVLWNPNVPAFSSFHLDPAWFVGERDNALSLLAAPGTIPALLTIGKGPGAQITLFWTASCSLGAEDYGIYEGTIGTWYSHTQIDCSDALGDLQEAVTPGAGNRYYLVVPNNPDVEGSYGTRSTGVQRPVGSVTCRAAQEIGCP
jgi:hypothetical protein